LPGEDTVEPFDFSRAGDVTHEDAFLLKSEVARRAAAQELPMIVVGPAADNDPKQAKLDTATSELGLVRPAPPLCYVGNVLAALVHEVRGILRPGNNQRVDFDATAADILSTPGNTQAAMAWLHRQVVSRGTRRSVTRKVGEAS
jgi:hypothetical protein